jgi:hydrogenase maturation protease
VHESLYLIIGVGNTLRCDDGAGIWLAEAVASALVERGHAVEIRLLQQLLPELAEEICELGAHTVLITDCSVESPSGQDRWVRRLVAVEGGRGHQRSEEGEQMAAGVEGHTVKMGSHGLGAAALIELARRLYGFTGEAWLATVPGVNFDHGEGLGPITKHAIDALIPEIMALIS